MFGGLPAWVTRQCKRAPALALGALIHENLSARVGGGTQWNLVEKRRDSSKQSGLPSGGKGGCTVGITFAELYVGFLSTLQRQTIATFAG